MFWLRVGASGQHRVPTLVSARALLEYLTSVGVVEARSAPVATAHDQLLAEYREVLLGERGRDSGTVLRYERFARRFLGNVLRARRRAGAEGLTSAEVNAYLGGVSRLVVESAKREAADLRALLRFLYVAGILEADLGAPCRRSRRGGERGFRRP